MTEPTSNRPTRFAAKARTVKHWLVLAIESRAFGAAVWLVLIAVAAFWLWRSPPDLVGWQSRFDKAVKVGTDKVDLLIRHPLVVFTLHVLQHPLAVVASIVLLFLVLLKDERVNLATRSAVALNTSSLAAYRIRVFAHRLGLVVVGLLAIFPGVPLLLAGGYALLPVVLIVPYVAIRIVAWVVAALFE